MSDKNAVSDGWKIVSGRSLCVARAHRAAIYGPLGAPYCLDCDCENVWGD